MEILAWVKEDVIVVKSLVAMAAVSFPESGMTLLQEKTYDLLATAIGVLQEIEDKIEKDGLDGE